MPTVNPTHSPRFALLCVLLALIGLIGSGHVAAQTDDPVALAVGYIQANPDNVGIACFPVDAFSAAAPGDDIAGAAFHNADESFVLASTGKIIVLADVALRVADGEVSLEERVPVAEIEAYYLPGTDAGAYDAWLDEAEVDEAGSVSLFDVLWGMIRFSGNAHTDYLIERFGTEAYGDLYTAFGVADMGAFPTILGLLLGALNPDDGPNMDALESTPEDHAAFMEALVARYLTDAAWREEAIALWNGRTAGLDLDALTAFETAFVSYLEAFFWSGTPRDFAAIMAQVYSGTALGEAASAIMREVLSWPMTLPGNSAVFATLGTKSGSLAGEILTAAYYGAALDGEPVALAVFYREWSTTFVHQLIEAVPIVEGSCQPFANLIADMAG